MLISFRDVPLDITNIAEEISLNVRRGLGKLKCENDSESTANITDKLNDFTIENMTSIDICNDMRAYYRSHEWKARDIVYTKKCWKAICCNDNLFKDKVVQTKSKCP